MRARTDRHVRTSSLSPTHHARRNGTSVYEEERYSLFVRSRRRHAITTIPCFLVLFSCWDRRRVGFRLLLRSMFAEYCYPTHCAAQALSAAWRKNETTTTTKRDESGGGSIRVRVVVSVWGRRRLSLVGWSVRCVAVPSRNDESARVPPRESALCY